MGNFRILILGNGQLMREVGEVCHTKGYVTETLSDQERDWQESLLHIVQTKVYDFLLLVQERWKPDVAVWLERHLHSGIPWVRVYSLFNEVLIGPMRRHGRRGCTECADTRRIMTLKDRTRVFQMKKRLMEGRVTSGCEWLTSAAVYLIAEWLCHMMEQSDENGSSYDNTLVIIDKKHLKLSTHQFLPVPTCPVCGELEEDRQDKVKDDFESEFNRNDTKGYRKHAFNDLRQKVFEDFVDPKTGVFNALLDEYESPFSVSVANLPLPVGKDEVGVGRTLSYDRSQVVAILEGIERYGGMEPRGKKTTVFDSYNNLSHVALDPRKLGLHSESQYNLPGFPFKPFDPAKKMYWVWGYCLTTNEPILVPEVCAYYGLNYRDGIQNSFVYEISNGCSLGGNLQEAILHGIFEVIERDAFLMAWYRKLRLKKINTESIADRETQLMLTKFEHVTDYDVHLFDMTMENGVPSVWALAKNRGDSGMNILCAAGAHCDPVKAIQSSLHEVAGILIALQDKFEKRKTALYEMVHNSHLVKHMEDHSLLYGLKETESRFDFLLDANNREYTIDELYSGKLYTGSLASDLQKLIQRFRDLELDVIVIDQTSEEMKRHALCCVKVLIPGMLPMTFGHDMRRVDGFEKLTKVPKQLGLKENGLNPFPHPFP